MVRPDDAKFERSIAEPQPFPESAARVAALKFAGPLIVRAMEKLSSSTFVSTGVAEASC